LSFVDAASLPNVRRQGLVCAATSGSSRICIGGGFALAAGRGWSAVSTNYGDIPPRDVLRGVAPVVGCYGGRDRKFGGNGALLKQHLAVLSIGKQRGFAPHRAVGSLGTAADSAVRPAAATSCRASGARRKATHSCTIQGSLTWLY